MQVPESDTERPADIQLGVGVEDGGIEKSRRAVGVASGLKSDAEVLEARAVDVVEEVEEAEGRLLGQQVPRSEDHRLLALLCSHSHGHDRVVFLGGEYSHADQLVGLALNRRDCG